MIGSYVGRQYLKQLINCRDSQLTAEQYEQSADEVLEFLRMLLRFNQQDLLKQELEAQQQFLQLEGKISRIFSGEEQDVKQTEEFALCLAKGFQRLIDVYEAGQPQYQTQLQTYETLERVVNPNAGARTDDVQLLCRKMNSRVLRRYAQMCYWNGEDCVYLQELADDDLLKKMLVSEDDAREVYGILEVERVIHL